MSEDIFEEMAKSYLGSKTKAPSGKIAGYRPLTRTTGNKDYDQWYDEEGRKNDIDPNLLFAQGFQESTFNPKAVSSAGARGIAQFMGDTAKEFGVNPNDPRSSINGQARLMRQLIDRTNDIDLALAGYNSGHNASIDRLRRNKERIPETRDYVARIRKNYDKTPNIDPFEAMASQYLAQPVKSQSDPFESMAEQYLQGTSAVKPVTEKPETLDAQTPVPEKIETLDAQFAVAKDPANKARTSVFFPNDGTNRALQYADKLDAKQWGLFPDKKHNGLHLINLVKAKKLKLRTPQEIQNFIDKNPNALKTLGIVVEDVGNNTQGTAVVAKDADGNELAAGVVTNPGSAVEQAKNYKDQFPNAQIEVTNTDDVVKARKDEVDLLAPTSPTGEADDPDEQGLLQARFAEAQKADPTLTVEKFNQLLRDEAKQKFLANKNTPGQQGQPPKENVDVAIKDIDEQPSEPQKFETSRVQTKDEPNVLFKVVTVDTKPYKGDRRAIARTALKQIAPEIGLSDAQIEQELDRVKNVGYYTADEKNGEVNIAFTQGDVERIAGKKFADTDLATKKAQQRIEAPGVTMPEIQQPSGTILQQIRGMTRSEIEGENLMWKYRFDPLYREALNNVADVGGTAKDVDDEYARLMSNENLTRQEAIEFGREKGRQYSDDTLGSLESGFVGEGGKAVSYPAAIMRAANGLIPGLNDVGGRKLQNWLTNTSLAMQAAGQVEAEKNPGVVSSVLRLTGSAPGFMSRFAVSALLPGGARLTFAKDAAITSFGEGNDLGQVFKDAGKGAVMDILFGAGSKFGDAVRKGTLNKLLPKSVIDAIESGALETAYKGTDEAKKAFINAARRSLVADVLGTSARIGVIGGGTYTLAAAEGSQHPGMDTAMMLAFDLVTHAKKIGKMAKLSTQVWRIPGKTSEAKPREIMFLTEGGDKIAVYDVTDKFPNEVVEGVLSKDVDRSAFTAREMPGQTAILLPEQMPEKAVEPKQPSGGKSDFIPTFTDQEKSEVLGSVHPTSKSREVQESKQTVEPKVESKAVEETPIKAEAPVEVKEAPRFKDGKREKVEKIDKQKYDTLDFEDEIPSQPAQVAAKMDVPDAKVSVDEKVSPAIPNGLKVGDKVTNGMYEGTVIDEDGEIAVEFYKREGGERQRQYKLDNWVKPTEVPVEGKTEVNQSKALRELGYTLPMQKKLSEAEKQEIVDKGIRRQDAEKKVETTESSNADIMDNGTQSATDSLPEPIKNTKKISEHFNNLVKGMDRDAVEELLYDWDEAGLNEDGDRLVRIGDFSRGDPKGVGTTSRLSKGEFINWLNSEAPFDETKYGKNIRNNKEYVDRINQARIASGLTKESLVSTAPTQPPIAEGVKSELVMKLISLPNRNLLNLKRK